MYRKWKSYTKELTCISCLKLSHSSVKVRKLNLRASSFSYPQGVYVIRPYRRCRVYRVTDTNISVMRTSHIIVPPSNTFSKYTTGQGTTRSSVILNFDMYASVSMVSPSGPGP